MCETRDLLKRLEGFLRETLRNCTNDWGYDSEDDSELKFLDNILSQIVKHPNGSVSNFLNSGDGQNITNFNGDPVIPADEPHNTTINKLEMIKVIVLIVVILIILITTCRMVFQLSMRFRPEKNNMNE